MEGIAKDFILTIFAQNDIQLEIETAFSKKYFCDLTAERIYESSEKLLNNLKVHKRQNEAGIVPITECLNQILKKKELIHNNLSNQYRQLIDKIDPARPLTEEEGEAEYIIYPRERTEEIELELLDYLLQHITILHQNCELVGRLILRTRGDLEEYIRGAKDMDNFIFSDATAENTFPIMLYGINNIKYCLLEVELAVNNIYKVTPDFRKAPTHN